MKKWHDINKKNLTIAVVVAVFGFLFALLIRILVKGDSVVANITRAVALWPFLAGIFLIWDELKKEKSKLKR